MAEEIVFCIPEMKFYLLGRFKPYVRMTQRSKWVDKEALAYLASKDVMANQVREQMQQHGWEMIPRGRPLWVEIDVLRTRHNRDLDNEIKAILDAAQGVAFEDDRWVDAIDARRQDTSVDGVTLRIYLRDPPAGCVAQVCDALAGNDELPFTDEPPRRCKVCGTTRHYTDKDGTIIYEEAGE